MSYVFLPRRRSRLRKQLKAPQRSANAVSDAIPSHVKQLGNHQPTASGGNASSVVRVGFTVFPIHTEKLNDLLIGLLQTTRTKCTTSDIIRIAIDELARRPLSEVAELLMEAHRLKPWRAPKQK